MKITHVFQLVLIATAILAQPVCAENREKYLRAPVPDRWTFSEHLSPTLPDEDSWWKGFEDPVLDSLISTGVKNNFNLSAARKRVEIARMNLKSARSAYFPTIGASAGWTKNRTSGLQLSGGGESVTTDYFDASLSASWEIDVFGKIASSAGEQKNLIKVSKAEYAGAMLSICAEIATTYIQLRVWQNELIVDNEHSTRQERIVKITEARHEAGLASMLDVRQAREVYYSTKASIPVLENSITTAMNSLSLLVGSYPGELNQLLSQPCPMPDYRRIIGTGIPAELLRRRPDIVAAEMTIAANASALGVAKKDFLPTLSIDGSIGTAAHNAGDLFKKESFTYTVAPRLTWTIFSGFSRSAAVTEARQTMRISIDNYNQTVMTAVCEVDNAISSYLSSIRHIDAIKETIDQTNESYKLSVDLYKRGLTPFNNVVSAQLNLLENENHMIVARGQALAALVSIYKSIGGGWTGLD